MKFMLKKRISNDDNITLKYLYKFVFHCVLQYFELYCHMLASNEKLDFKVSYITKICAITIPCEVIGVFRK